VSMISASPGTLAIGTDPDEWDEGDGAVRAHVQSFGDGARATLEEAKGYSKGDVGWGAARGYVEAGGARFPVKLTVVVVCEDGGWKVVQSHASPG
jgi:SnoaL-like domain